MLIIVGLGLGDERDITCRGLEEVKKADLVYLETYTSILLGLSPEKLAAYYGVDKILEADRRLVESRSHELLSTEKRICLLVVGDGLCATTHSALILQAREKEVKVEVIPNASIVSAIAITGLQIYRFGEIVSIPFFDGNWRPFSFFDKIIENRNRGLHTLCLLDIKVKEQTIHNLLKNNEIFEDPQYMTCQIAVSQIQEAAESRGIQVDEWEFVGCARLGRDDQKILFGKYELILKTNLGDPLHSLVICGKLHPCEKQFLL